MTILLLDSFVVSLQVDIHMEFYSALKISKTHLFTTPKSTRNIMIMIVREIGSLYDFAMFNSILMPGERQRNSILLLTQAPRYIGGSKMKFCQMNFKVIFSAIASQTAMIRIHKAVLLSVQWQVYSLYFRKPQFLPPWASM